MYVYIYGVHPTLYHALIREGKQFFYCRPPYSKEAATKIPLTLKSGSYKRYKTWEEACHHTAIATIIKSGTRIGYKAESIIARDIASACVTSEDILSDFEKTLGAMRNTPPKYLLACDLHLFGLISDKRLHKHYSRCERSYIDIGVSSELIFLDGKLKVEPFIDEIYTRIRKESHCNNIEVSRLEDIKAFLIFLKLLHPPFLRNTESKTYKDLYKHVTYRIRKHYAIDKQSRRNPWDIKRGLNAQLRIKL